jgi:protoporphyrin/coproporphyrin ferrochelatase
MSILAANNLQDQLMGYFHAAADTAASGSANRIGVLLVNLGTPDSPTYFAVQRYLREFLSDRRVIDTPRPIWLPLLYGYVLPLRPFKTARNYRKIWMPEGSPLAVYSKRLAAKIAASLQDRCGDRVITQLAMTYGNPSVESAVARFAQQGIDKLLVLPLYPHYCSSTTGSVFDATHRGLQRWRWLPETRFINDYYADGGYIDALTAQISKHWDAASERSHLLFSYHGIPSSYVKNGDPYKHQAEETTRLVVARLGLRDAQFSHCYQSRFGRVEWLKPYTVDTIRELAARGVRKIDVVSPSFAVDCLETLEEVAVEYRDRFLEFGGERLLLVPGLNDEPQHVKALTAILENRLQGWT